MTEFVTMRDGKNVAVTYWENVSSPRGVVILVHGMCEYIGRYDDFAKYLNSNGYYVIGMDNRSFGATDADARGKGYEGMFEDTVDDIKQELDIAKERWNTDNIMVIGHSYGSFLTQRFIEKYHDFVKGAILCGSALQDGIVLKVGSTIANKKFKKDPDGKGKIFAKLTFESYDKKLKDGLNGWINRDMAAVEAYNADEKCNFMCANSFYKSMFDGLKTTNKERGRVPSDFKLMIASGTADGVGGYGKLVRKLAKAYKSKCGLTPKVKLYEGGRHEILNEINKGEVYEDFLNFVDDVLSAEK